MKWFEGSINEAVATSKSRKAIFVVFIEGKDDASTQLAQTINATEVSSRLEEETFVAIRLESGSETYRFFAQIYHLVPVPSIFFIGENGIPLEIIAANLTPSELIVKIDAVLTKAGKDKKNSSSQLIGAEQKAAAVNNVIDNSASTTNSSHTSDKAATLIAEEKLAKPVPNDSPTDNSTVKDDTKAEASTSLKDCEAPVNTETKEEIRAKELTAEEKLERARKLLELQKEQRLEEEERKERERELERRRVGRDVQMMRQKQQDLQIKLAYKERMKEKAEEAAAREKVRQQIAEDKLERQQKKLALQEMQGYQKQEKPFTPAVSDATVARIQFRLPSGSPHMGQFEPSSTLRALRTYVFENIELPSRQFAMSTSFPRRDLTHEDDDKTLLELELVPTAVILILPLKSSNVTTTVTSTRDAGFPFQLIWSLFTPIINVYNYIVGYFSRGTHTNTDRQRGDSNRAGDGADGSATSNLQNVANSAGVYRRHLSNQGGTTTRAEGNIHRLHSRRDDNDENNTWNGNSTQQM